jgi:hypothetical protein
MKSHLGTCAAVSVFCLASACSSAPPPTARAAGVRQLQCDPTATSLDALVRSTKVLSVEPLYSHIMTTNSSEERVDGTKLLIRPPAGVSAEQMTRILQCHGARVLLGQVNRDAVRNDPYWLPDSWVNIQVTPENGNFAVTVSAESLSDNLKVFGRANQYADDHMLATEPELP